MILPNNNRGNYFAETKLHDLYFVASLALTARRNGRGHRQTTNKTRPK